MLLFIFVGVIGCIHAGTISTTTAHMTTTKPGPTVQTSSNRPTDSTDNRASSNTTINNKINVDSLTAENIKHGGVNKRPITTTMIAAVYEVNEVNGTSGNSSTKDTKIAADNALKDSVKVPSKGIPTESSSDNIINVVEASIDISGVDTITVNPALAAVNESLDIAVDSTLEGSIKLISDNKIKPDIHITNALTGSPLATNVVVIPAELDKDTPIENTLVKIHVAGDLPFGLNTEIKNATGNNNPPDEHKSDISKDEIPKTGIKNRDNVPTKAELIASGAENVDFVQHRVVDPVIHEIPKTGIKNKDNVPTKAELIEAGAENVDLVQHIDGFPTDSSRNKVPKTGIKNRDNVPTKAELIASGAENVDFVQHRVVDTVIHEIPKTSIKNRDNVPTKAELIEAGAENVDLVQHIDGFPTDSSRNKVPKTDIKNRDNVPTKAELIAAGEENVDRVQHRIEFPTDLSSNKVPKTGIKNRDNVPTKAELIEAGAEHVDRVQHRIEFPTDSSRNKVPKTGIKNRDNVPTRAELIASGAENVDLVQHRVEFPTDLNSNKIPKTGIKNRDNVPTNDELIEAGAENVNFVQHRVVDTGIHEIPKSGIKNRDNVPTKTELIEAGAEHVDRVQHRVEFPTDLSSNKVPKTRIKNRHNVPTKAELIEAGAENVDFVQHRVVDTIIHEIPKTGIKNRDNVPTEAELIEAGAEHVDRVQHRVEFPTDLSSNQVPKTGIKNRHNVPTKAELIEAGAENVDFVQHRVVDTVIHEIPKTGIKNRGNVPTRRELVDMGAENVDHLQHRVEDTIDLNWLIKNTNVNDNGTERQNVAVDSVDRAHVGVSDSSNTGAANKHTVPTRNEQLPMEVTNDKFAQAAGDGFQSRRVVNNPIVGGNANNLNTFTNVAEMISQSIGRAADANVVDSNLGSTRWLTDQAAGTTTTENQPKTNKQIPVPKRATPTSLTKSNKQTTNGHSHSTGNVVNSLIHNVNGVTSDVTTHVLTNNHNNKMGTVTGCPVKKCAVTCKYGYKEDENGCRTCGCLYSNSCPRTLPISGMLCLLQVRRRANQSCASDLDCRRNRICCPGTCGNICRRESRNRSMLLSMLLD